MNIRAFSVIAAAAGIGMFASGASALTMGPLECEDGGITLTPSTWTTCDGAFLGNDSQLAFENDINTVFGTSGTWSEAAKVEEGAWEVNGLKLTSGQGDKSGTFSIDAIPSSAVFVVKATGCFSAYYFTGISAPATGSFDTEAAGLLTGNGCDGKNSPGISHLTLYTGGDDPDMSVMPLPAAAWMLLAGIAGLFGLRRIKA